MFGKFDANTGASGGSISVTGPVTIGPADISVDASITSGAKRITWCFRGVTKNTVGSTHLSVIRVGSGAIVTTGYVQCGGWQGGANTNLSNNSTGFIWFDFATFTAADLVLQATCIFTLMDETNNIWAFQLTGSNTVAARDENMQAGGSIALAGALTIVRLTTLSGVPVFTAGEYSLIVE